MDAGGLVSDDIIIGLVTDGSPSPTVRRGSYSTASAHDPAGRCDESRGVKLDVVLEIDVPDEAIIERMSGRRVHAPSGRTYHIKFIPPQKDGVDDVTGEPLIQRDDDKEETVRRGWRFHTPDAPAVGTTRPWAARGDSQARAMAHRRHRQRRRNPCRALAGWRAELTTKARAHGYRRQGFHCHRRGIGARRGHARMLASNGGKVVIADLQAERGAEVAKEIGGIRQMRRQQEADAQDAVAAASAAAS